MPTAEGIYYYEYGGGEHSLDTIVLLHGAGGAKEQWPHQLRRLHGWRVLAPDLPGHGRSRAGSLTSIEAHASKIGQWLDSLEVETTVVAGHSMGGAIALQLALARRDFVRGLVLLSCAAQMPVNPRLLDRLAIPRHVQPAAHSIADWSFGPLASAELRTKFYSQLLATDANVLYEDFRSCNGFDVRDQLAGVRAPSLVLCGAEDRMIAPEAARALGAGLRKGQFLSVENTGHMVMVEKPRRVAAAMRDFLQQLSGVQGV